MNIGPYTQGEKPVPVVWTFKDEDGVVIDLTGYTAKFQYRRRSIAQDAATTADATVTTAASGEVTYTWTGSEFTDDGTYYGQFWVGDGTNRFASDRINWTVNESVGVAPSI